jgi:A/G-specific adenine glycosylase
VGWARVKVPTQPAAARVDGVAGGVPGDQGAALRAWYEEHGRGLAIRRTRDPWAILVAEVMAQQTQVSRVEGAWEAFMVAYPHPATLAAARPREVLRLWGGLGYNRRAVLLQRAAARIVAGHGGRVPRDLDALRALPGVGPYTARAVAATAFGLPVAPVDTNVRRVVSRLAGTGVEGEPPLPLREAQVVADAMLDRSDPAAWAHAMMDLGSSVCLPRVPRCGACPLRAGCRAARRIAGAPDAELHPPARAQRRSGAVPFERTSRWLRGRIVERLRALGDDAWVRVVGPLGPHDEGAVEAALVGLERDGLLERRPDGLVRLPSGTAGSSGKG